jgi:hypothetical protein
MLVKNVNSPYLLTLLHIYSQLSIIQVMGGGGDITDNPKPWLKQKQSKHGTK